MSYRTRIYIATESNDFFDKGYLYLYILHTSENSNSLRSMETFLDSNIGLDFDSRLRLYKVISLNKRHAKIVDESILVTIGTFFNLFKKDKLVIVKDCMLDISETK